MQNYENYKLESYILMNLTFVNYESREDTQDFFVATNFSRCSSFLFYQVDLLEQISSCREEKAATSNCIRYVHSPLLQTHRCSGWRLWCAKKVRKRIMQNITTTMQKCSWRQKRDDGLLLQHLICTEGGGQRRAYRLKYFTPSSSSR